jgi:hypothetical protein
MLIEVCSLLDKNWGRKWVARSKRYATACQATIVVTLVTQSTAFIARPRVPMNAAALLDEQILPGPESHPPELLCQELFNLLNTSLAVAGLM